MPTDLLLPADLMHAQIEHERLRADRSGGVFSVVDFALVEDKRRKAAMAELLRILRLRLRGSDRAGMLRDGRVAILLPDTTAEGGRRLGQEVQAMWFAATPAPTVEVHVYPSDATTTDFHDRVDRSRQSAGGRAGAAHGVELLLLKPMPAWKRLLDVLGALVGLTALSPLLLLVAIAIKLSSPGPVFFRQRRSGRGGKPFWLYKFRSMVADAEQRKEQLMEQNEQDGPAFKIEKDPRVTPLGRLLRATSIDELPQLWNVLKGDMSLVGPRPLPCDESDRCDGWHRRRLDVTPGLTCFWQVKEERTKIPFADWVRMDLRYIKSRSPKVDGSLIVATFRHIFRRKGC